MELDKIFQERRTVRKYFTKDVPWLLVSEVLNAGHLAPSSGNIQNWKFIVIRSKETKEKVIKYAGGNEWALKAPVLIVICMDFEKAKRMYGSRGELYSMQNSALTALQMMLKAQELGLSTGWIGSFDEASIIKVLEIDKSCRPLLILSLGYGETMNKLERYDLSTMTFFEKFGEKERKGDYAMLPLSVVAKRNVEHMKDKLHAAFEDEGSLHKAKVKHFIDKLRKKK
jgi:nitroreductase